LPPQKLRWIERGSEATSRGTLWKFQLRAGPWALGVTGLNEQYRRMNGRCRAIGWGNSRRSLEIPGRQGVVWRTANIRRPWRDRSTLERMGELRDKTIGVMVRLPVWDKGERRERDGPADSTGRFWVRRMAYDQLTDHWCGPSQRVLWWLVTMLRDGRAGA
jgi:hypothetical protein